MCDKATVSITEAELTPATVEGTFIVVRDVTTAGLHIKGQFDTADEAQALASELTDDGYDAAIAFIPNKPGIGRTDRKVVEVPVSAPTVDVLVLK